MRTWESVCLKRYPRPSPPFKNRPSCLAWSEPAVAGCGKPQASTRGKMRFSLNSFKGDYKGGLLGGSGELSK